MSQREKMQKLDWVLTGIIILGSLVIWTGYIQIHPFTHHSKTAQISQACTEKEEIGKYKNAPNGAIWWTHNQLVSNLKSKTQKYAMQWIKLEMDEGKMHSIIFHIIGVNRKNKIRLIVRVEESTQENSLIAQFIQKKEMQKFSMKDFFSCDQAIYEAELEHMVVLTPLKITQKQWIELQNAIKTSKSNTPPPEMEAEVAPNAVDTSEKIVSPPSGIITLTNDCLPTHCTFQITEGTFYSQPIFRGLIKMMDNKTLVLRLFGVSIYTIMIHIIDSPAVSTDLDGFLKHRSVPLQSIFTHPITTQNDLLLMTTMEYPYTALQDALQPSAH